MAKEMPHQRYVAAVPILVDVLLPLNSSSCATELCGDENIPYSVICGY